MLRESMTDPYFLRRFSGVSFEHADFSVAFDVSGDATVASKDLGHARRELGAACHQPVAGAAAGTSTSVCLLGPYIDRGQSAIERRSSVPPRTGYLRAHAARRPQ